jgi:hypothetical protein
MDGTETLLGRTRMVGAPEHKAAEAKQGVPWNPRPLRLPLTRKEAVGVGSRTSAAKRPGPSTDCPPNADRRDTGQAP